MGPFVAVLLATQVAPSPAAGWTTVAPGVEHVRIEEGAVELVRFDLARYRVEVMVPGAARPMSAAEVRAERRAVLAVNGGFFDTDGRPLGLRLSGKKTVQGLRKRVDWGVLLCRAGRASIVHSREYAAAAPDAEVEAALQVGPRVLVAGEVPRLKPQSSRRTAVAVDASGRTLTVLVTRGRMGATELGQALQRLGFTDALLLDGGPSTQMSVAAGSLKLDVPGGYGVPDALAIVPR